VEEMNVDGDVRRLYLDWLITWDVSWMAGMDEGA